MKMSTINPISEMAAGLYAPCVFEVAHRQTGPVTRGYNIKSADESSDVISDYNPLHLPLHNF